MLVLTRKPAEIIRIGEDVVIKVIKTERRENKICNQSKLEMKRHISLNPNKHGDIK